MIVDPLQLDLAITLADLKKEAHNHPDIIGVITSLKNKNPTTSSFAFLRAKDLAGHFENDGENKLDLIYHVMIESYLNEKKKWEGTDRWYGGRLLALENSAENSNKILLYVIAQLMNANELLHLCMNYLANMDKEKTDTAILIDLLKKLKKDQDDLSNFIERTMGNLNDTTGKMERASDNAAIPDAQPGQPSY